MHAQCAEQWENITYNVSIKDDSVVLKKLIKGFRLV